MLLRRSRPITSRRRLSFDSHQRPRRPSRPKPATRRFALPSKTIAPPGCLLPPPRPLFEPRTWTSTLSSRTTTSPSQLFSHLLQTPRQYQKPRTSPAWTPILISGMISSPNHLSSSSSRATLRRIPQQHIAKTPKTHRPIGACQARLLLCIRISPSHLYLWLCLPQRILPPLTTCRLPRVRP
jgi:hypothetical protein